MTTPTTMEERFEEKKKDFIAVKKGEWWSSDEDFILSFIQSEIDLAKEEERKEIVEMVSGYPEKLIKIMPSGKLPFVIFGGKAYEEEKKTIYFQAFKDIINLITKK